MTHSHTHTQLHSKYISSVFPSVTFNTTNLQFSDLNWQEKGCTIKFYFYALSPIKKLSDLFHLQKEMTHFVFYFLYQIWNCLSIKDKTPVMITYQVSLWCLVWRIHCPERCMDHIVFIQNLQNFNHLLMTGVIDKRKSDIDTGAMYPNFTALAT